jgi:hypothetical protein
MQVPLYINSHTRNFVCLHYSMRDTNGTAAAKLSSTSDLVFSYDSKDPPGLDVYINQAVPYYDQYLLFPSMYHLRVISNANGILDWLREFPML